MPQFLAKLDAVFKQWQSLETASSSLTKGSSVTTPVQPELTAASLEIDSSGLFFDDRAVNLIEAD